MFKLDAAAVSICNFPPGCVVPMPTLPLKVPVVAVMVPPVTFVALVAVPVRLPEILFRTEVPAGSKKKVGSDLSENRVAVMPYVPLKVASALMVRGALMFNASPSAEAGLGEG